MGINVAQVNLLQLSYLLVLPTMCCVRNTVQGIWEDQNNYKDDVIFPYIDMCLIT